MQHKDSEGRRYAGYGSTKGKEQAAENQRDPETDVSHMPRHWQSSGTRGETPGQPSPGPDRREVARGNQYGEAGRVASDQVQQELDEHGRQAPQRRENEQVSKRPGERPRDLPTPGKPGERK